MVMPIQHALQGHPESGALWEKHINGILMEIGFKSTTHKKSLYKARIDDTKFLLCRQVDDIAVASTNPEVSNKVISQKVDMVNKGLLTLFNGVDVEQTDTPLNDVSSPLLTMSTFWLIMLITLLLTLGLVLATAMSSELTAEKYLSVIDPSLVETLFVSRTLPECAGLWVSLQSILDGHDHVLGQGCSVLRLVPVNIRVVHPNVGWNLRWWQVGVGVRCICCCDRHSECRR